MGFLLPGDLHPSRISVREVKRALLGLHLPVYNRGQASDIIGLTCEPRTKDLAVLKRHSYGVIDARDWSQTTAQITACRFESQRQPEANPVEMRYNSGNG